MKKKGILTAAGLLALLCSFAAYAGSWIDINQDGSTWMYLQDEGGYLSNSWLQDGETWYYMNQFGQMVTGRVAVNGKYEMFDESGAWLYSIDDSAPQTGPGGEAVQAASEQAPAEPEKTAEDLEAEAIASSILSVIVNDSMTKPEKANAIYAWIRANTTYSNNGMYPPEYSEGFAAVYGFTAHRGNCYVYYSMSKYLLGLCDMPSQRVVRASDGNHFWNLVDVDGTWYHFDACPRRIAGRWCLVTTAYLQQVSWSAHNFDVAAYPATP